MLAEGSEGQRRTFRAEPMGTAANWFRLPEKKNPAPRPLACGVSSNIPVLFPKRAPALVGQRPPLPAKMSAFKYHIESDACLLESPTQ